MRGHAPRGDKHERQGTMTYDELIDTVAGVLRCRNVGGRYFGDVAVALMTDQGSVFTGICIDTPRWGLCAERSAIAAMATAGEYRIPALVAVWKEDETVAPDGLLYVLPPCGHCRQFLRDIDEGNLEARVLLGPDQGGKLKELLPCHAWPEPIPRQR
jgi:cytidine deaminase